MKIFGMMGSGLVILTTIVSVAIASKSGAPSSDSLQSERNDFYGSFNKPLSTVPEYGIYDTMHQLADDYDLPHVVKQGLKKTAEVHKFTYCNLMKMHGAMVRAASPVIGTEDLHRIKHHPLVQYGNFCK